MNSQVKGMPVRLFRISHTIPVNSKWFTWLEIGGVVGFAFLLIWVIAPLKNNGLTAGSVLLVLSFIGLVSVRNGENRMTLGFGTTYLKPAGFYCLIVTLGIVGIIGIWGHLAGTLRWEWTLVRRIFWYFFWAAFQQVIFQVFFTNQLKKVIPNKIGVAFASALIFALIHLPNGVLMGATFFSGFCWALIYCSYPNLFSIALSHATLAVLLKFSLSDVLICGLRIGPGC